ncbi:MAG: 2-oxoacid:acceptor oxidoreductase family protein, partial [Acidobacteriota bacterium]
DTGWIVLFAKDAQQAADQSLILRRVTELALNPGINAQDGFLTSHLERTFVMHEAELIRQFLGSPNDIIDCPTPAQKELFGATRRRVPRLIDLTNPILLGPVQNQEHYMNGVVARRNNFSEAILPFLERSFEAFAELTGRSYGLISPYHLDDAETVFLSIGSAAENIEAGVDYLRANRGAKVGSIHLNVIRPFPEAALINALAGKKNVIVLERTDESLAGAGPLQRDLRTAFSKALENGRGGVHPGLPAMTPDQAPRIFGGVYGLGSRDFRPEHILGAYELVSEGRARQDGLTAEKGASYFVLGVDHPYAVCSEETPSLLPDDAIAVRLHSIGGWGMITTGKNLSEIIGDLGNFIAKRDGAVDEHGREKEVLHVSANPKYGSEKKGAPTSYFLVVAPERIRPNCDLRHVDVVLCCDPKAFSHTNPLDGLVEGGAFVWESDETPEMAWQRIPPRYRQEILDKDIRVFTLPGFRIAREATTRKDLQLRMQGNSFLGAFFNVSPFLKNNAIEPEVFKTTVREQYEKKFGRFGEKVIESNMQVMAQGFELVTEVAHGQLDAPDLSSMRGTGILPTVDCGDCRPLTAPPEQPERIPLSRRETFDREFRAGLGYHQPASTLASVGMVAAGTGDAASKFGARREIPIFIAENCTQCMECIAACPDTALPNTAQDVGTILSTAVRHYVTDGTARLKLLGEIDGIEERARAAMLVSAKDKSGRPFQDIVREEVAQLETIPAESRNELTAVIDTLPLAYSKTTAIFAAKEKKDPGNGGIFSIFVSDLCTGCGECVTECGRHEALKMVPEDEVLTAKNQTADGFFNLLADTDQKYL